VNGTRGILRRIRYRLNEQGERLLLSCVVEAHKVRASYGLEPDHIVALRESESIQLVHPYTKKKCTIRRTQVPIMPAFALTAHKAQGQTMDHVMVDLSRCRGTESPYVMLSRAKSLNGVLLLRDFDKSKITCRQSEDSRRESVRLEYHDLLTVINCGSQSEANIAFDTLGDGNWDQLRTPAIPTDVHPFIHNLNKAAACYQRLYQLQEQHIRLLRCASPPKKTSNLIGHIHMTKVYDSDDDDEAGNSCHGSSSPVHFATGSFRPSTPSPSIDSSLTFSPNPPSKRPLSFMEKEFSSDEDNSNSDTHNPTSRKQPRRKRPRIIQR
jgi:hypothetical protein